MAEPCGAGGDLDRWLVPFLDALGHKKRRTWAPLYLRGLMGPGERKSLQPMAARLGLSGHDQLQHFIASPAWDDAPLWRVLAEQVDRQVGGEGAGVVPVLGFVGQPDAALVDRDRPQPRVGQRREQGGEVLLAAGVAGHEQHGAVGARAGVQRSQRAGAAGEGHRGGVVRRELAEVVGGGVLGATRQDHEPECALRIGCALSIVSGSR